MSDTPQTWPELAHQLYERLTGANAEITYDFENMEIEAPSRTGRDAERATWKLNGVLKIRTRNLSAS